MCDNEWQRMIRCDKKSEALELIFKMPNENGFFSSVDDKVL